MTVESPILRPTPKAILRSRGLGWTLAAIAIVALVSGPTIWLAFTFFWTMTGGFGLDWAGFLSVGFGFILIAAPFVLPISLPAAILNALLQSRLARHGRTAWGWAMLAATIGGLAGALLSLFLDFEAHYPLFVDAVTDPAFIIAFLLTAAAMGALHRRLAFWREVVNIDTGNNTRRLL